MRAGSLVGALCCFTLACVSPPSTARRASRSPTIPADATAGLGAVERAMVDATNRERAAARLPTLATDLRLVHAAQIQAEQMAQFGVMAHEIPRATYPTLETRLDYVRYPFADAAENVAKNYSSGTTAVAGWMASAPHRANMMAPEFTQFGVGYAVSSRGDKYYAAVYGKPR